MTFRHICFAGQTSQHVKNADFVAADLGHSEFNCLGPVRIHRESSAGLRQLTLIASKQLRLNVNRGWCILLRQGLSFVPGDQRSR